jgi:hypothetical protein
VSHVGGGMNKEKRLAYDVHKLSRIALQKTPICVSPPHLITAVIICEDCTRVAYTIPEMHRKLSIVDVVRGRVVFLCGWVAGAEGDRDDLAGREEAGKIPGCLLPCEWAEIWTEEDLGAKVGHVAHCPRVTIVGQG